MPPSSPARFPTVATGNLELELRVGQPEQPSSRHRFASLNSFSSLGVITTPSIILAAHDSPEPRERRLLAQQNLIIDFLSNFPRQKSVYLNDPRLNLSNV